MEGFKDYFDRILKQLPRKLLSLSVQVLLLPVSVLISACGAFPVYNVVIMLVYGVITSPNDFGVILILGVPIYILEGVIGHICLNWLANILQKLLFKFKNMSYSTETFSDNTYTYTAEVDHDIKDSYGTVIGSYTTTETKESYMLSDEVYKRIWACTIALPCRIIAILLAVLSIFSTKFYVSVKTPQLEGATYNEFLYRYFDLVIPKKK